MIDSPLINVLVKENTPPLFPAPGGANVGRPVFWGGLLMGRLVSSS